MNTVLSNLLLHLLESTCWVLCLLLLLQIFRVKQSGIRCWIFRLSFVKFLLPTFLLGAFFRGPEIGELAPYVVYASGSIHDFNEQLLTQPRSISVAVIGGMVALTLIIVGALITSLQHRKIILGMQNFDPKLQNALNEVLLSRGCGTETLSGCTIEEGPSIGLYGIFRPRIIAKREFLKCLNTEELHSALQHEFLHWKNRDHWWRLFVETMVSVLWFHPLVWFLRKQLNLETEKRCDEEVIGAGTKSSSYANCLLKAASFNQGLRMYGGAIALSESALKQRVSNVIQYQYRKVNRMKIVTMAALAGVALTGSLMVFGSGAETPTKIFELGEVDEKPAVKEDVPPVYPKELKAARINGMVVIQFVLDEQGNVESAFVEKSTDARFEEAALEALKQWKFYNAVKDGKAVKVRVRAPLVFKSENPSNEDTFVADSIYDKIQSSKDPADIEFLKTWQPRWDAISKLHKEKWDSREEANAWSEMAGVIYGELRDYMAAKETADNAE